MKLTKISVDGYRLLDGFEMDVQDDLSLVIGKNNTGKTSLLNVLNAFLAPTKSNFAFEDFSLPTQRALLKGILEGENSLPNPPPRIILAIEIRYDEDDNLRDLSHLMVDLSPEARTVNLRFQSEITPDGYALLRAEVLGNIEAVEDALSSQLTAPEKQEEVRRFLSKNLQRYLTRLVVSYDPQDATVALDLTPEPALIRRVLHLEYVSARRSVQNRDSTRGTKTAGRSLSSLSSDYFNHSTGGNENSSNYIQFAAQASVTDRAFNSTYATVFKDMLDKIKRFGAGTDFNGDIHITSAIDPGALLQDSTVVKYGDPGALLPEDHNGLGYLNLISMIMEIEIRLLRMRTAHESGPSNINLLVIEEPEAHTHPQLQYIFIKQIKGLLKDYEQTHQQQLQTIITTHSSHITAESDFADIKYFRRVGDRVEARNMTDLKARYANDDKQYHFLTQYLTLTRAELFFADKVVLIEGDTERILMRAMMNKVDSDSPDHPSPLRSQNISVVEVGAHAHVFDHFIEFTGLKTLVLTDIDSAEVVVDDNDKRKLRPCAVAQGTHTTNNTLRHFLGLKQSALDEDGDLRSLRELKKESKQLSKSSGRWEVATENPTLFLAYQFAEEGYEARSYEDAFIHINRGFIKENAEAFRGLKKTEAFADESKGAFELAQLCVRKKTHFALDVLYSESGSASMWSVPAYIREGLTWLRDA